MSCQAGDAELTMNDAARHARICRRTLDRWLAHGLPSHQHGVWRTAPRFVFRSDLEEFAERWRGGHPEGGRESASR